MLKKTFSAALIALALATSAHAAGGMKAAGSHANLASTTCHTPTMQTMPTRDTCLTCHESYDKLAERTAKLTPNPHASHRGAQNCTSCHSMHAKPRFECNDCHTFNIKMKGE